MDTEERAADAPAEADLGPPPRPLDGPTWLLLAGVLVGIGVEVGVGMASSDGSRTTAEIAGRTLGQFLFAALIAGVVWLVSRRSVVAFKVTLGALLLLGAAGTVRRWQGERASESALRALKSEVEPLRESLLSEDGSVVSDARDRVIDAIRRVAGATQGDASTYVRILGDHLASRARRQKEYEAGWDSHASLEPVRGTEPDAKALLAARQERLRELGQMARRLEGEARDMESTLDRALEREGMRPPVRKAFLSGLQRRRDARISFAHQEVVAADALLELEVLLSEHLGRWHRDEETGEPVFDNPAARTSYEGLKRRMEEAVERQDDAKRRVMDVAADPVR